ncbi:MAG: anti-sigma factor antagonist [Methanomicrobia archaeon]|nr:anti-sigma factor antagonist [Methanomicrobia archaeon]
MEIQVERIDSIPLISLDGRLDAFGAEQLDEALKSAITPEDSTVVIDMANVSYLSSGGIRTLLAAEKQLKPRNGGIQLCSLQSYPLKVLAMAGFDQLFAIWPTREAALKHTRALLSRREVKVQWDRLPTFTSSGARFTVLETSHDEAVLKVTSDISKVLYARLGDEDICTRRFSETEYSIGLGALGENVSACAPYLGEMITIGGTMVWLPTDGHDTPDFLIAQRDTGEVTIFTGFNVALDGPFHDLIVMVREGETGMTIGEIYATIFEFARKHRPAFKGLLSLALWADVDAVYSSGVKISPIKKFAPANREMIMHPDNIAQWLDISTMPKHAGETMVSLGMGLDLQSDLSSLDRDAINALFYLHPANVGNKQMLLHNHGVIFKHMPWERTPDLDEAIKRIVTEGEFIDMRHLLDNTSVSRAVIGISYIAEVLFEEPTQIAIAGASCPGWNETYERITRKLHHDCSEVLLTPITGGYSGSLVFRVNAWDRSGRKEMPFVLKLGRWANVHDEIRGYEEHVKRYIQNNATQIIEHCKLGEFGGILYNFVGITGTESKIGSLEDFYRAHSTDEALAAFDKLFRVVLRAWYGQPKLTELSLYEEYGSFYNYEAIRAYADSHFGITPNQEFIELPFGLGQAVNPLYFAEKIMPARSSKSVSVYQASVHGDLNMKNVLMDEEANMWLIDFSETEHAHILRDIAKLEAVLKFESFAITSEEQLRALVELEQRFLDTKSLSEIPQLPYSVSIEDPNVRKAFRCVQRLREYANVVTLLDEEISQYWFSLLWYTLIVLAFGSVDEYGKRYAWISSALLCQKLL